MSHESSSSTPTRETAGLSPDSYHLRIEHRFDQLGTLTIINLLTGHYEGSLVSEFWAELRPGHHPNSHCYYEVCDRDRNHRSFAYYQGNGLKHLQRFPLRQPNLFVVDPLPDYSILPPHIDFSTFADELLRIADDITLERILTKDRIAELRMVLFNHAIA